MKHALPTEAEIRRVMADIGVDYVQAYRHVKQRHEILKELDAKRKKTLGAASSCYNAKNAHPI